MEILYRCGIVYPSRRQEQILHKSHVGGHKRSLNCAKAMAGSIDNKPLNEIFESHLISEAQRPLRKSQIIDAFSGYVDENSFNKWYLGLYRFATTKPLSFLEWATVNEALAFFDQHPTSTIDGVTALQRELSHAIFAALRPGASWGREGKLSLDRPDQMAEFESTWHPEYQRYCEHIFNHLIQLPLYVIGVSHQNIVER
jgi:hypothetical protein